MKPTKFSPGPWNYRLTGADCCYAVECDLSHRKHKSTEERIGTFETLNEANAALISAAPEMYDRIVEFERLLSLGSGDFTKADIDIELTLIQCRDILKKARGEK